MTEPELAQIETELDLPLPSDYRKFGVAECWDESIREPPAIGCFRNRVHPTTQQRHKFLLTYPQALIDTKLDLGWMQEAPADRQLYNTPTRLIQLNQDVRAPGTPWVGESGAWPDQYFVIGDDQCGNYWCIDRQGLDPAIWFYDHEVGAFERHHDSLQQFAAYLLVYIAEFNADRPPQSDV
jgi:hypothetical protein